ncbi:MAG: hypothetical protein P3X22_005045 [Thermoprotei archaeon]|nr:hypothetical protein [Thermoprotei archaeon]
MKPNRSSFLRLAGGKSVLTAMDGGQERTKTVMMILNIIVAVAILAVGWVIVYYLVWERFLDRVPELQMVIGELRLTSLVWWIKVFDFLLMILTIIIAVIGTIWVLVHVIAELPDTGKWIFYWRSPEGRRDVWVLKLTLSHRLQHVVMILTFLICMITGFIMYYTPNVQWIDTLYMLHVISGIIMGMLVLAHFFYYSTIFIGVSLTRGFQAAVNSFPMLSIYSFSYLRSLIETILWGLGKVPRPKYHKYNPEQLFEYWGVYWGILILGVPGLLMALYGSGLLEGTLWHLHFTEAVLAVTFIVIVHIGFGHARPYNFPVDLTFIHGKIPLKRIEEEHPLWLEELKSKGEV